MARGIAATHRIVTDELTTQRKALAELKGKRVIECATKSVHPGMTHKHQHELIEAGRRSGQLAIEQLKQVVGKV